MMFGDFKYKNYVVASFVAALFLYQVAYNIGDFPISFDFLMYAVIFLVVIRGGDLRLDFFALFFYVAFVVVALINHDESSLFSSFNSLALMLTLYFPFCFYVSGASKEGINWIQRNFVVCVVVICACACVQFLMVNFLKIESAMNISMVLPDEILSAGTYARIREDGYFIKANGFFLKEASLLSEKAAMAIVSALALGFSSSVLFLLGLGLVLSASGTGILSLLIAFLAPTKPRNIPLAIGLLVLFYVAFDLLKDVSFLSIWMERLFEFEMEGSSGYARFVAPFEMLDKGFTDIGWMLFGNGAGSYQRTIEFLNLKYEISDPTWAKLLYEYGIVGFVLTTILFARRVYLSGIPPRFANCIMYTWLFAGGNVLKPDYILIVWIITAWVDDRQKK